MKLDKLNSWITLLANIGVIGGLIFLGYEIRQNTTQLRSQASYSINEGLTALNASVYNDSVLADIVFRGKRDFSSLNPTEKFQFSAYQYDRINLAIHVLKLEEEGIADIHGPYIDTMIQQYHTNPGLQDFLNSTEILRDTVPEIYNMLLLPKK